MGVDREAAVRKAEDLTREGKFDLAIEEYLRLVDDQAGDVGAANALGDLYAKVGNKKLAVAQFTQIGDTHRESGFIPKAVAFYKKALKVEPGSDHALSQLAQIAVEQELYADATLYLNRLLQRRREQGNEAGVAEIVVRLGGFPSANAEAKMAAARAAAGHFTREQATRLWIEAADALDRASRPGDALDVLFQASNLDADDPELRRRIVQACAATGQIDRARPFLSLESAGDHPDLLLAFAERALGEGHEHEARTALLRVIDVAPHRRAEAETLLGPLAPVAPPEVPPVVSSDDDSFEIAVDVDEPTVEPAVDPPVVARESAFVIEPTSFTAAVPEQNAGPQPQHEPDPEPQPEPIAQAPAVDVPVIAEAVVVATEAQTPEPDHAPEPERPVASVAVEPERVVEPASVIEAKPAAAVEPAAPMVVPPTPAPPAATTPAVGVDADTVAALTAAAQNPALQFQASAQLGRLLIRGGALGEGIVWLERSAQAATSAREQRLDVMYELADALERHGQGARALDVFADLDLDAASFRDVPERIAQLRRALEEGRAT